MDTIKSNLVAIENEALHTKICSDLSFIRELTKFDKEIELLDEIENIHWKLYAGDLSKAQAPKSVTTSDELAASQGVKIPPHVQCQSRVFSLISMIDALEKFIKLTIRLLRQIKIRLSVKNLEFVEDNAIEKVKLLCMRFHTAVRTLKRRPRKEEPFLIKNEYDVQYICICY